MDSEQDPSREGEEWGRLIAMVLRRLRGFMSRRPRSIRAGLCLLAVLVCGSILLPHSRRRVPVKPAIQPAPIKVNLGPPGIVLHNSDSPASWHGVALNAARLEAIHAEEHPGWATVCDGKIYHIGYHYVILPSGKIEIGRPENCLGMHARMYNDWIGICVIGAFSTNRHWWPEHPTPAQVRSIVKLCEYLMSKYHIPPELVKRHRDINETYCPGDRFPYFKILAQLKAYAASHPETRGTPGRVLTLAKPKRHQRRTYPARLGMPVQPPKTSHQG